MGSLIEKYKHAEPISKDSSDERMIDYAKSMLVAKGYWLVMNASIISSLCLNLNEDHNFSDNLDYFGVGLIAGGFALWSKSMGKLFKDLKESNFSQKGVYNYFRHPAYLGFRIASLGMLAIVPTLESLIAVSAIFVTTELTAIAEEKEQIVKNGREYFEYLNKTNRFLW